jgi:hypothetical protein
MGMDEYVKLVRDIRQQWPIEMPESEKTAYTITIIQEMSKDRRTVEIGASRVQGKEVLQGDSRPPTEKQMRFLTNMAKELGIDQVPVIKTVAEASKLIEQYRQRLYGARKP